MRQLLAATAIALSAILTTGVTVDGPTTAAGVRSDVIVTLRGAARAADSGDRTSVQAVRADIRARADRLGVRPTAIYPSIGRVFATSVTPSQRITLERHPIVRWVEDDLPVVGEDMDGAEVRLDGDIETTGRSKVVGRPAKERLRRQVVPTWLKRVGATKVIGGLGNGKTTRRFDADVAIIDSGISRHPDVRPAGGKDCSRSGSWADGYGHGLGVASILGAKDNKTGIVGMLPGVRLWSVRIFDSKGRGSVSGVLCALDFVARKRDPRDRSKPFFEGATMSFSVTTQDGRPANDRTCGRSTRDPIHKAVCRIVKRGTILVAAAGNYAERVRYRRPAAYPEVITVSAMADFDGKPGGKGRQSQACLAGSAFERDDAFATFSSFGNAVDLIAPGKCIWVAYKGGTYARVTGTSFATPIVMAAALKYRERYPNASPNQVRMALIRAGRRDWRVGTDRDARHEPRVDLRRLQPPPTFRMHDVARHRVFRGATVSVPLRIERRYGHTASVGLRLVKAPTGLNVRIEGMRVVVKARAAAAIGLRHVVVRVTDGDVTRTVRVPIQVRPAR
ncbi:MAG: S8 family serine peptidase [Chloroflexi bacterium]|nr:S8 family serine peptidase [Chloroflexota bacterium]